MVVSCVTIRFPKTTLRIQESASELFRGKTSKTIAVALHMRIFTGEKHEGYKDKLKIN